MHVDGTSQLARYDFLLVFYSDVARSIHSYWDIECQSQRSSLNISNETTIEFSSNNY